MSGSVVARSTKPLPKINNAARVIAVTGYSATVMLMGDVLV
jgi:hypothetical protein